jgi:hypothetical protein
MNSINRPSCFFTMTIGYEESQCNYWKWTEVHGAFKAHTENTILMQLNVNTT